MLALVSRSASAARRQPIELAASNCALKAAASAPLATSIAAMAGPVSVVVIEPVLKAVNDQLGAVVGLCGRS